jgi:hypothetical protein
MRERDKPRPLTTRREKWEHYWYYYKIHTFAGLFVLLLIAMTVRDCSQRIVPDVSWGYQGMILTAEQQEALIQEWLPLIEDANGDGEKHIHIYSLTEPQQIVVMMAAGDTQIFSFDLENFSNFAKNGAFLPLDELIAGGNIDLEPFPEVRLTAQDTPESHVYGLPLEPSRFLNDAGLRVEGSYLGLRVPKTSSKSADNIASENARAIAKQLISAH